MIVETTAACVSKIDLNDAQMEVARAAGRSMYNSGTPVTSAVEESFFRSSAYMNPPVDALALPALCTLKTNDFDGVKSVAVVSPCEKKPLFTMDQFKPLVAHDLASLKKEYNVCDVEFDDPFTCDEAEYEEQVADSRPVHCNTLDVRSERALRRSARKKKLNDDATNVHKYADMKRMSSRKISPSLIS